MEVLIIDRMKWLRGIGGEQSKLLDANGRMCCLGFECRRLGLEKRDILGVVVPHNTMGKPLPFWLMEVNTNKEMGLSGTDVGEAMFTNDDRCLSEIQREAKLTVIFARHDVELRFVN